MASSYSQYKIELQNTGENSGTWGTITNANFGSATPGVYQGFEQAIGGRADVTMSSTTVTLTLTDTNAAQDARALYLNLSGTPGGAADLVVPALQKAYLVKNGTNAVVTIKVTGQTGVPVPVGRTVWVYNNGTDVVTAVDHIPALTLGAALPVASGGTGQTSYVNGELLIGNTTGNTLTKATLTAGTGISITNGTGSISIAATNNGDVVGPASSTDNAVARFDLTTGKIIQNSGVTIDDANVMSGATQLNVDNLRLDGNTISSTNSNGNIVLAPNGTGDVQVDADTLRVGDSNANATITTNGTGDLILNTNAGTNSGFITIADAANGDISLAPNGNGSVVITNAGTSNALRITQTGSGNALLVEDSANPDSTPFVIDSSGRTLIGHTTSLLVPVAATGLQVQTYPLQINGASQTASIASNSWSNTIGGGSAISFNKSRGTTPGDYTISSSGDTLGFVQFTGSDGTAFIQAAQISAAVDGTPGTNDMPGRLVFSTTADGASSPTERMRIDSEGSVGIGTASIGATGRLRVSAPITGAASSAGLRVDGTIQSGVTTAAWGYRAVMGTQAAAFTLTSLTHYEAFQTTLGASSAVTNQYGFAAQSNLVGATNNYGFYSNIASGTGRWNFYANGTADNYFAGQVQLGAGTVSAPALSTTGDTNTGIFFPAADTIAFAEGGAEAMRIDSSGNVLVGTTTAVQQLTVNGYASVNGNNISADNSLGFRNRIINGDMRIDQRNAGAAVTSNGAFPVDRFAVTNTTDGAFSAQQDSSVPAGFNSSLKITATTADATIGAAQAFVIRQFIEGYNVADLNFGSANAKTVTLSFWVRSSLTGTFSGSLTNGAYDRSYPFTYSISAADTWEQKSITIAGDTSGTWLTTNGNGMRVYWNLGTGTDNTGTANAWVGAGNVGADSTVSVISTLNATWYITGVQLEVGSVATPFERRPYGTELSLCQRYLPCFDATSSGTINMLGYSYGTNTNIIIFPFQVPARVPPTGITTTALSTLTVLNGTNTSQAPSTFTFNNGGSYSASCLTTQASGFTAGQPCRLETGAAKIYFNGCEL